MPKSLWTDTVSLPEFEPLQGDKKADVLVIGGGICGIMCTYFLRQAGVDCLLVEGNRIASGTTKNTTAKLTSQHGLIYDKLIRSLGTERAAWYLDANQKALEQYRLLCRTIDCDFEEKSAFVYALGDREKIEREVQAVNLLGFPAEFAEHLPLPLDTVGAVRFPHQAQFHPLKFLARIVKGLPIYEHTFVQNIEGKTAVTSRGRITADQIIVATHFPFLNRHGGYFLKLYQHRSYVLALEQAAQVDGMYLDEAQGGLSFRNSGDLLLLGGGSHRTGKQGGSWQELERFASSSYPQAQEVYRWAAQDCMSLDQVPYIGQYASSTPNLYVASGFHKWGMTTSMAAAMLLCDLVQHRNNPWAELFLPQRSMLHPQLFYNIAEATKHLLTPAVRRCAHMGCGLKWNPQEHTWDCPCHGSRFEQDGTLIDNPAKHNAKHWKLPQNRTDNNR